MLLLLLLLLFFIFFLLVTWYYIKWYNLCHNLFMWWVLSDKNVFPCRITIISLPFITRHINKLYHKLWTNYTTNGIILCVTIITLFAFIFFLIHVLLFFSVLSFFFFRNFSPVTLLQFIALDWLLNRLNTQYSLLGFTWGWLSLNYKFIWIQ